MVEDLAQKQHKDNESIEEVNNIIRHEIKKAFEIVNIQSVAAPMIGAEQNFWPEGSDRYEEFTKTLINDAIKALKNEDIKEGQARLTSAYQRMSFDTVDQTSKLFMERAIRALKNENTKEAITTLELAYGI